MSREEKIIENLEKNNMLGFYAENKFEVVPIIKTLINPGDSVAVGGSVTLFESGVIDLLRNGDYTFRDRHKPGITEQEKHEVFLDSFSCDVYLSSCNAVTEYGELYNVDANSNRVAAICYGPKSVILVAGWNKIVKNIDEAVARVKTVAAPKNARRLSCNSYCAQNGRCVSESIGKGCGGASGICCNYLVSAYQRHKNRIKVIIVGENLGY